MMTMLVVATMMTAASAQETELIGRGAALYLTDSLKLDSMYNYWNDFVTQHPKDDAAWRNLFEVSENKVFRMINATKDWKGGEEYRKQLNVVGRMEKAIPGHQWHIVTNDVPRPSMASSVREAILKLLNNE